MRRLQYSEKEIPWDGNTSKIPDPQTLVAVNTASSGLFNMLVTGYKITWRDDNPQIRIMLCHCDDKKLTNERMLGELHFPLTIREKNLIKEAKS